ncbi:MAG: GerW family sporulation protein [Bacteroidota bacterium]
METNFEQLLEKLSEKVKGMANTDTIVGEEFTLGEFRCKPVIKVGLGFGAGVGEGEDPKIKQKGKGNGAGAGIGIAPVGFLVTKGDEISFISSDNRKGLAGIFEKVPDLMEKMMDMKKKKE